MTWVGPLARNFPTEVLETQVPWRITRYALREDSGGVGRHRGGVGIVREYETLSEGLTFNATGHYGVFPPKGFAGGGDSALSEHRMGTDSARAPTRGPPATGAAARSRPSPTPTSFSAAGSSSTRSAQRPRSGRGSPTLSGSM